MSWSPMLSNRTKLNDRSTIISEISLNWNGHTKWNVISWVLQSALFVFKYNISMPCLSPIVSGCALVGQAGLYCHLMQLGLISSISGGDSYCSGPTNIGAGNQYQQCLSGSLVLEQFSGTAYCDAGKILSTVGIKYTKPGGFTVFPH